MNYEPILIQDLARKAEISEEEALDFFHEHFGSYEEYCQMCRDGRIDDWFCAIYSEGG